MQSWEPGVYFESLSRAYEMAGLGANCCVLATFFVVDKRLEMSINKEMSVFRRGSGWLLTHVVHRLHANIIYRMYCTISPANANFKRDISAEELTSLTRAYHLQYGNDHADINRIFYIFQYLRTGVLSRKICNNCGMDYIFNSKRNYNTCPFCEMHSELFKK